MTHRPWRVVAVSVLLCLLCGTGALFVPVDVSFTGLLDPDDPLIARYNQVSRRLNLVGRLPLLLEGDAAALDEAAATLASRLERSPWVERVLDPPPTTWFEERAPWLVDDEAFDLWLGLATRPEDRSGAERLAEKLDALDAERQRWRRPGHRLVTVVMTQDPLLRPIGDNGFREIEAATAELLAPLGVTGTFGGLAALAQQDQEQVIEKVRLLTPLSLLLVLLVLRRVEPRLRHLLAVAAPLVLSVIATLGIVGVLTGGLNMIEAFFGVMVFGLGIDFALHLIVRSREAQEQGDPPEVALRVAVGSTGPGVVAGGLTTALAFFVVAAAPDPITRHLGLSGGLGLVFCLVLMMTLLPALWVLLGHGAPPRRRGNLSLPLLRVIAGVSTRHPRLTLALAALLFVAAAAGAPRARFETDLQRVFSREVPATETMARLQELYGINPHPWIAIADSVDDARRLGDGFLASPLFDRVDSVARLLPTGAAARQDRLEAASEEIHLQKAAYQILKVLSTDEQAEALDDAIELLASLERARDQGPPTLEQLPESLRSQLLTPEGRPVVFAYVSEPRIDGRRAQEERLAAEAVAPEAAGPALIYETLLLGDHPWVMPVLLGILAAVALVLGVDLRRPRWVVLALVPVLFGTGVTFGLLCWAGLRFNVMTTVVIPLLIGLGVDDGIHLVHRLRAHPTAPPEEAATAVGQAIVMTTLTTCVSMATMLFTDHPGLESMAIVVILGLPLCLLATVTLVPALAAVAFGGASGA